MRRPSSSGNSTSPPAPSGRSPRCTSTAAARWPLSQRLASPGGRVSMCGDSEASPSRYRNSRKASTCSQGTPRESATHSRTALTVGLKRCSKRSSGADQGLPGRASVPRRAEGRQSPPSSARRNSPAASAGGRAPSTDTTGVGSACSCEPPGPKANRDRASRIARTWLVSTVTEASPNKVGNCKPTSAQLQARVRRLSTGTDSL
mmetsp:Transcript_23326/g.66403  ORF Transcript_23326/g.66403 Transcript_23326/m.66403 type:complete len:204 (-) Transcript_23326:1006-1617(-)